MSEAEWTVPFMVVLYFNREFVWVTVRFASSKIVLPETGLEQRQGSSTVIQSSSKLR